MIHTHRQIDRDLALEADAVVVGTGAGGGPVAAELAKTGKRVIVLEAGEWINPVQFNQREEAMLPRLFFDGGGRTTKDKAIAIHQGKGVGGSTIHNTNLVKRVPDEILGHWYEDRKLTALPRETLDALYAEVEAQLFVRPMTEANLNANNRILRRGAEALGYKGGFLSHNREGCIGSGFCELGCAFNAKMNSQRVYVPEAVGAGAEILADTWAVRFDHDGKRATRLHAWVRDPATGAKKQKIEVAFKQLVLSASSTGTPAILQRSDAPDPYGQTGGQFHIHPGAAVSGFFDEEISAWRGIPQSWEVTEFLRFEPGAAQRVWIVNAFAHPIGAASFVPGFGNAHREIMEQYPRMAVVSPMVHDESSGRVRANGEFGVTLDYKMDAADTSQMKLGLRESARILFAAGARRVLVPLEIPIWLESASDVAKVDEIDLKPYRAMITAVHPMASCPMGDDPRNSVAAADGRHHQLSNVHIADASLYPTSIGGPPQLTAYALGLHVGRAVAAEL